MDLTSRFAAIKERIERWHWLVTLWHLTKIIGGTSAVVIGAITIIIGYWNRSDKANVADIKDPFQQFLNDDVARFLLAHRWLIIALSIVITTMILVSIYRSMKRKLKSLSCLNSFAAEYYDILTKLRAFTLATKTGSGASYDARVLEEMCREIVSFLENSVNELSKLFEMYTGRKCHVSLKFCNGEQVKTFVRDGLSFQDRGAIDEHLKWYPYRDNTAFVTILEDRHSSSFICNHLRFRSILGKYKNRRADWTKFYTACAVIPITVNSHSAEITRDTVWGFLCIDNKGGGFDKESSQDILQACAKMYCFVLGVLSTISPNTS